MADDTPTLEDLQAEVARYEAERVVLAAEVARLEHELGSKQLAADAWRKVAETWQERAEAAGWKP